ncbi:phosphotransferase [Candidatus Bathyarchaeota archaeon]|nr:phosphotransferase [Candidatus Bathyarchaeota archaeon]MBT7912777.1 phosphotransferase [Candidatus Bathyarchaeota archaeon]
MKLEISMINPNYTLDEIESRLFSYIETKLGPFNIEERLSQIQGGNEAYLYRFRVAGIDGLEKTQILRLFPSHYSSERSEWEGMIHNLLAEAGIMVPKVHLMSSDMSVLTGSFMMMDFVEGNAINPGDDSNILSLAARTQAGIHEIEGAGISKSIWAMGHSENSHNLKGRIDWLIRRAEAYSQTREITKWLIDNMPESTMTRVVHGDFHPMNFMIKDGKVMGILDWSNFMIGDPMMGLGFTISLFTSTSGHVVPKEELAQGIEMYFAEYSKVRPIDYTNLEYYRAFRLAMAYIEGLDGQEWWQQPELVKNIATELKEFTGITVPT